MARPIPIEKCHICEEAYGLEFYHAPKNFYGDTFAGYAPHQCNPENENYKKYMEEVDVSMEELKKEHPEYFKNRENKS